jgi:O-glycosyl hydrolase
MVPLLSILALSAWTQAATTSKWSQPRNSDTTVIHVNISKEFQIFDGMGISQAFQRGNIIYGSDGLSPANTTKVLDLLFSNQTGAGLTILRNGIGSSAAGPYDLMKSILPTSPGSPRAKPNYTWDGNDNGQIRLSRDAMARGVKTIYATAWSAPGFMKNNSHDSNGGYLCGVSGINCTTGDWRQPYADYLVQYLKFYRNEGIPVNQIGFLNEPDLK